MKKKSSAKKKASTVRSRNSRVMKVKACNLLPDPLNWHTHGEEQRSALLSIFKEVGFVGYVLVRKGPTRGKFYIIDGHERVEAIKTEHSDQAEVDCCLVNLSEDEARKILATHDSIGSMGGVDDEALEELLSGISFSDEELESVITSALNVDFGNIDDESDEEGESSSFSTVSRGEVKTKHECPKCGYKWG